MSLQIIDSIEKWKIELYLLYNKVDVDNILVVIVSTSDMTMTVLQMPIGLQLDLFCFQPNNDAVVLFIMT